MTHLSRRGLLGLMAAAPVAAVAKPEAAALSLSPFEYMDAASYRRLQGYEIVASHTFDPPIEIQIDGRIFGSGGGPLCPAPDCRDCDPRDFNSLSTCRDHPRIWWPTSRADDEGPGAPAKTQTPGGCPPASVAAPTGAPAPEPASDARGGDLPERSPDTSLLRSRAASDHPILKQARAC